MSNEESLSRRVYEFMSSVSAIGDKYAEAMKRLVERSQSSALDAIENPEDSFEARTLAKDLSEEFLVLTELLYYVGLALAKLDEQPQKQPAVASATEPNEDEDLPN